MTAENLKPRNAKPPLHLLPWRAILALTPEHVPPDIAAAIRATGTEHGRAFFEDVAKRLLARAGADAIALAFADGIKPGKYLPFNWADDPTRRDDYAGALFRHLCAEHGSFGVAPQDRDPDSGELHCGHAGASAFIWLHLDSAKSVPVTERLVDRDPADCSAWTRSFAYHAAALEYASLAEAGGNYAAVVPANRGWDVRVRREAP